MSQNPDPCTMPSTDAADLEWIFGHGWAMFERSTCGAMLDRLIADSEGSRRCGVCRGVGILNDQGAVARHKGRGKPWQQRSREVAAFRGGMWTTEEHTEREMVCEGSWCQVCGGTGSVPDRKPGQSEPHAVYQLGGDYILEGGYDVRVGHAQRESTGIVPDSGALVRFARTSRRLAMLPSLDRTVLWLYFGDPGARWGGHEKASRMFSLYPLTQGGARLLGASRWQEIPGIADGRGAAAVAERLWSIVAAHIAQPNHRTQLAMRAAEDEAGDLLLRATRAWCATAPERDLIAELRSRYPEHSAWDDLIGELDSWGSEDGSAPFPTRQHDGVWR